MLYSLPTGYSVYVLHEIDVLGEVFSYPDPLPSLEPAEIKVICPKHKWLEAWYCNTEGTLQRRNLAWSGIKPRAIWTSRQVLWGFLIPAPGIFMPLLLTLYLYRAGVLPTGCCIHLHIPIIVWGVPYPDPLPSLFTVSYQLRLKLSALSTNHWKPD